MGQDSAVGESRGAGSQDGPPATPRWVKVSGWVALVVVIVLVAVVVFGGGEHGPGRHAPMRGTGADDAADVAGDADADAAVNVDAVNVDAHGPGQLAWLRMSALTSGGALVRVRAGGDAQAAPGRE